MSAHFEQLKQFIQTGMQTSHIYQPAMLIKLLESGGVASPEDIAKYLLTFDDSQVEYYEYRVKNMVGKVLSGHQITVPVKEKNKIVGYQLAGVNQLTDEEAQELIQLCQERLEAELGRDRFRHRNHRRAAISGSQRYEILKRSKHRCEACGTPADERAIDIDHIVPKSLGGSDDSSNLQALCYVCNRNKGNRDDTDFRAVAASYDERSQECPFCTEIHDRIEEENELAIAFLDGYPVTPGHTLVIPKRHVADYFELHQPELNAINQLLQSRKVCLQGNDPSITGFNVGINAGASAGQTVFHCHIHLIPRRDGDMENPKGGVRGVIPERQKY